ncbi:MAG: diguanylate cyclase [Chloroflexota bacterium]
MIVADCKVDTLTGLHLGPAFRQALDDALAKMETVTLALLDIDSFKGLNDTHGHEAGDALLSGLGARLLRLAEDSSGIAGRLGGDEFAVALPEMPLENAFLRLERFRAQLVNEAEVIRGLPDYRPTVSIGLANFPRDVQSAADLMSRADQALWAAKQSGRNTVSLPPSQDMVLKSCHYTRAQVGRLKALAEKQSAKESALLREALDDLLRKHDVK